MDRDVEQIEIKKIRSLADFKGKKVLEIGCGDGRVSSELADRTESYIAIDPDRECILQARSRTEAVDFQTGTGEALEFEAESFDIVLFTFSLHHQNPGAALKEAERVVAESGTVIILEPAADGEVQAFYNIFNDETRVLARALYEIEAGDLVVGHKEIFCTLWAFDDEKELYAFPFDGQNGDPDEDILKKMDRLLGGKIGSRPIRIEDKTLLFSLKKKG